MPITINDTTMVLEGVIYEDEIQTVRDALQELAPQKMTFDFKGCDDAHLGVLQVILAYLKMYDAEFVYGNRVRLYQKVCEGFDQSEQHCG